MNSLAYCRRIIAFYDILGFSELVKKDEHGKNRIHAALLAAQGREQGREGQYVQKWVAENNQRKSISFSDCVVLTSEEDESEFQEMISCLANVQAYLLSNGILTRGGLTVGKVFDEYQLLYGPGVVEAYELESKKAVAPRIIINKDAYIGDKEDTIKKLFILNEENWKNSFLAEDSDCEIFIDYLKYMKISQEKLNTKIKRNIEISFTNMTPARVREKFWWLKNYYNNTYYTSDKLQQITNDFKIVREHKLLKSIQGLERNN